MANIETTRGESPLVVAAIHNGHEIRPALLPFINLTERERLREEDPFTAEWTRIANNSIRVETSRFETDVNRPPEKAVYRRPEDAWGLDLWKEPLPRDIVEGSLQKYDDFYRQMEIYFDSLFEVYPWLVVYDLHSYNDRREGVDKYGLPEENPEINLGTQHIDHNVWSPVIESLVQTMRGFNFEGRHLDVRENVKFKGGYFSQWLCQRYKEKICPISIEVKKFFMDEWTGEPNALNIQHIRELLIASIQPTLKTAAKIHQELAYERQHSH